MNPPFVFEPRSSTLLEIAQRNSREQRSGAREFLEPEEAREAARNAQSAVPDRLTSWGQHPDESVALALLANRDLVREPAQAHIEELQSVQAIAQFLPAYAVRSAQERGLVWTALLEGLAKTGIASLRRAGRAHLHRDWQEQGPLATYLSQASEAEVLELLRGQSKDFREAVYASLTQFTEAVQEQAWKDETVGLHGLARNRRLPADWLQALAGRALENLEPLGRSYTYSYQFQRRGRRHTYGIAQQDAAESFVMMVEAGHALPEFALESLRKLAEPQEAEQRYGLPKQRSISFRTLLRLPGALDEAGIRHLLERDVWQKEALPVEELLAHPAMPMDVWPLLLNRAPEHARSVVQALQGRVEESRAIRDVLRGDTRSSSLLVDGWGVEEFRSTWRVLAAREPERALSLLTYDEESSARAGWLRREDWAFLLDVVREWNVKHQMDQHRGDEREATSTEARILAAIPAAMRDSEVRRALGSSHDPEVLRGLLGAASPEEVRPLFRRYAEVSLPSLARAMREDEAARWLGLLEMQDLALLLASTNGEVRQTAIALMGQVARERQADLPEWPVVRERLESEEEGERTEAWEQAVRRFPRELVQAMADGKALLGQMPEVARRALLAHPDRWVRAEALLLFPRREAQVRML